MDKIIDVYGGDKNKINNNKGKNKKRVLKKKLVIKNKKKFYIAIAALIVIILFILVLKSTFGKKKIDNTTNITELKLSKYSEQIREYYELEGSKDNFIDEFNNIQNQVWMYIYNNISEERTMEDVIVEVNTVLESDDWTKLELEKSKIWKGSYYIDKENNALKFKFESKEIEPSWSNDETLQNIIVHND